MAFDAHTDTLLLVVSSTANGYQLVSLRRNASEWLEVQRLDTSILITRLWSHGCVRLACAARKQRREHVVRVRRECRTHSARRGQCDSARLQIYGLACTRRDNDTLVAFSHCYHRCLCIGSRHSHCVSSRSRASHDLTDPRRLLFRGELLLVADWKTRYYTETHAIVSFRATGNALTERRVLLDAPLSECYLSERLGSRGRPTRSH